MSASDCIIVSAGRSYCVRGSGDPPMLLFRSEFPGRERERNVDFLVGNGIARQSASRSTRRCTEHVLQSGCGWRPKCGETMSEIAPSGCRPSGWLNLSLANDSTVKREYPQAGALSCR